ncbi:MAG: L-aspartate oxidase [Phycisphaerales bacterium]|nr:L-aspartate oxidase [Phycisphaerales bacterium]
MSSQFFDSRRYLIPFRSSLLPQIFCDTLVIGSGVAGARAAIAAAELGDVIVLAKDEAPPAGANNTSWAQGGIAAVFDSSDTFDGHIQDTLTAGAGLCDDGVVRRVVRDGPARIREIINWGMRFDLDGAGVPMLGREGGHNFSRILHSQGDATGRELMRCLWEQLTRTPSVRVFTKCFALDLITQGQEPGSPVMGAITHHPKFGLQMIWAKSTILASGGAGMIYRETTNPKVATGDGVALAYRAGASIADMAFVQFHPTCLYVAGAARWLITEAVRGAGAHLVDSDGVRFMQTEHALGELAPRDVVTRGIVRRLAARGGDSVFLDCRHIERFGEKFPGIVQLLTRFDLNPATDLIPVHPAAHYTIGGVLSDELGRTDVPGLYSVGECSCSGLHGANRLASNSLLEGLVLGELAGKAASARTKGNGALSEMMATFNGGGGVELPLPTPEWGAPVRPAPVPIVSDIRPPESAELDLTDVLSSLRSAMWRNCGIERKGTKLADLNHMIDFWGRYTLDKIFDDVAGWQLQNMLTTGWLMARSALWREESRGCHWREDHPATRDDFRVHDVWRRGHASPITRKVQTGAGG